MWEVIWYYIQIMQGVDDLSFCLYPWLPETYSSYQKDLSPNLFFQFHFFPYRFVSNSKPGVSIEIILLSWEVDKNSFKQIFVFF